MPSVTDELQLSDDISLSHFIWPAAGWASLPLKKEALHRARCSGFAISHGLMPPPMGEKLRAKSGAYEGLGARPFHDQ